MKQNPKYQKMIAENRWIKVASLKNYKMKDLASFLSCPTLDYLVNFSTLKNSFHGKYKLPQPAFATHKRLYAGIMNPYIEKFQHLMLISFEAGLPRMWRLFHYRKLKKLDIETTVEYRKNEIIKEEKTDVDIEALIPIFVILVIGLLLALFAFLCEILVHDLVKPYIKYRKMKGNRIRRKNLNAKVKRNQVRERI
jgi:hypothetical protein